MIRSGFRGHPLHKLQLGLILSHVRDLNFEHQGKLIEMIGRRVIEGRLTIGMGWCGDDEVVDEPSSLALQEKITRVVGEVGVSILCFDQGGHNPQRSRTLEIDRWLESLYSRH